MIIFPRMFLTPMKPRYFSNTFQTKLHTERRSMSRWQILSFLNPLYKLNGAAESSIIRWISYFQKSRKKEFIFTRTQSSYLLSTILTIPIINIVEEATKKKKKHCDGYQRRIYLRRL